MAKKSTELATEILENIDIRYDEFIDDIFIMKDVSDQDVLIKAGRMTDIQIYSIQTFIERKYNHALNTNKAIEAINLAASQNIFSSVFEWIESKRWDGESRLWNIGSKVFGVDNPAVNKAIGIWLINMVGGAYGVDTGKFQYTLDIIGNQGTGKTSFLKRLGGKYYTDQFMSFTKKDDFEVMMKNLIVNDDEMQITAFSKDKVFKKFVSTNEFSYRPAYGRKNVTKGRHFVIARTSNDSSYLTDIGGNRRIIPVILNEEKIETPAFSLPNSWYENVLGEARKYYNKHVIDEINDEMKEIDFSNMTENLNVYAELNDGILFVLKSEYEFTERIGVTNLNRAVERYLFSQGIEYDSKVLKNQINMVMQREKYVKKSTKINNKTVRAYVKK